MAANTPQPRLPLEPEEYPLYKPPNRVGCSGLTVVTLLLVAAFAFTWQAAQPVAKAIVDVPRSLLPESEREVDITPGVGAVTTQTAVPVPTVAPTEVPPTPVIEYVQVANTGGANVAMRAQPQTTAKLVVSVGAGAKLKIIGTDVLDPNKSIGNWRPVQLLGNDGRSGYIQGKYLIPASAP